MDLKEPEVFIIDDEPDLLNICAESLGSGYRVRTFVSPQQALQEFDRENPPDVILTDLKMPGMDGFQLVRELGTRDYHSPVIMMTGFAERSKLMDAIHHGVFGLLEKPFDPENLKELVDRAVQHKRAETLSQRLIDRHRARDRILNELTEEYRELLLKTENRLFELGHAWMEPEHAPYSMRKDEARRAREDDARKLAQEISRLSLAFDELKRARLSPFENQ